MRRGSAALPLRMVTILFLAGLTGIALPPSVEAQDWEEEAGNTFFRYDRLEFYGFIKLDASYDSARMNNSNAPGWVVPTTKRNDDEFGMSINQTMLGMRFKGPYSDKVDVTGRFEFDLMDPDVFDLTNANAMRSDKTSFYLRHAYMNLDFHDFEILAGQTWDVVSPLRPRSVNYAINWWAGNMGNRRPQIRFTKGTDNMEVQFALTKTVGKHRGLANMDTGSDGGLPTAQARVSWSLPILGDNVMEMGISGHYGIEEIDHPFGESHARSASGNIDLTIPMGRFVTFVGEYFYGKNLDAYYGGVGQGLSGTVVDAYEVRSKGGWFQLQTVITQNLKFNAGAGVDNPNRVTGTLPGTNHIRRNANIFWNTFYTVCPGVHIGFEMSHWNTHYYGTPNDDRDNTRYQLAFIYNF